MPTNPNWSEQVRISPGSVQALTTQANIKEMLHFVNIPNSSGFPTPGCRYMQASMKNMYWACAFAGGRGAAAPG